MKFLIAFALIAVTSAGVIKPTQVSQEIADIIAAIQSPSTDPATAVALAALLQDVMDTPIASGPAIFGFPIPDGGAITAEEPMVVPSPVVIGEIPAGATPLIQIIVNVNQQESAVVAPAPVEAGVVMPGPVNVVDHVVAPIDPVQVVQPVIVDPVQVVQPVIVDPVQVVSPVLPGPVNVVEGIEVGPVQVVDPVLPGPVNVVEGIAVSPVQVVDPVITSPVQVVDPVVIQPVQVGTPIIPVVVIPDILN